jgi:hypothetical protein
MGRNARKVATVAGIVVNRSGKLKHCSILVSGDRIWELREVGVAGNIIYSVNAALVNQIHQDLDLSFKGQLYVTILSGTTGSLNVLYE